MAARWFNIPRLNATDMLERLRNRRLVFVGDSLNRNMWESLVCVLRNSVKDKTKVFEASSKREFRTEGSYSFLFKIEAGGLRMRVGYWMERSGPLRRGGGEYLYLRQKNKVSYLRQRGPEWYG